MCGVNYKDISHDNYKGPGCSGWRVLGVERMGRIDM